MPGVDPISRAVSRRSKPLAFFLPDKAERSRSLNSFRRAYRPAWTVFRSPSAAEPGSDRETILTRVFSSFPPRLRAFSIKTDRSRRARCS